MFIEDHDWKIHAKQHKGIKPALRKATNSSAQLVGERQIKFTYSTEQMDRDYDVIKQTGIDVSTYLTNPVAFFDHSYNQIIGRTVSLGLEDDSLTGIIEFIPFDNPAFGQLAEGLYQAARDGFISTVSIGFIATEWKFADDEQRYARDGADVNRCELVEVSLVGIPSNRGALIQEIGTGPVVEPMPTITLEQPKYYAPRMRRVLAAML